MNVTGTVTHGGKPLPKVMVYFTPDVGRPSYGLTDEQGHYKSLYYTNTKSGVVAGSHTVHVDYHAPINSIEDEMKARAGKLPSMPEWESVPEKYKKNETSPIKVEVQTEGQVVDFALD